MIENIFVFLTKRMCFFICPSCSVNLLGLVQVFTNQKKFVYSQFKSLDTMSEFFKSFFTKSEFNRLYRELRPKVDICSNCGMVETCKACRGFFYTMKFFLPKYNKRSVELSL